MGRAPSVLGVVYAVMAGLLAAYLVSLVVRPPDETWPWIDGWGVSVYEVILACLLLARGFGSRSGRAVHLVLGSAALALASGDLALTWESWGGASSLATPSIADVFHACFYPLAYAAILLMLRKGTRRLMPATWLDGAIAGLGAAAVCAAFAFAALWHFVGDASFVSPLGLAVGLLYAIGDVLLLAFGVGGTALRAGRTLPWMLFATACAVNAIRDTFNLFGTTAHFWIIFNELAHPASMLLISASVLVPAQRRNLLQPSRAPGFLLPGVGAVAAVVILVVGAWQHPVPQIAVGLATATLMVTGLRFWLSVRAMAALTEERHRRAVTDELTGLGNRYRLTSLLDAYFDEAADSSTPPRSLAFLFVDLDHFKEINDSLGHAAGDELLKQLGPRLLNSLRASDVLVRIGGDELGVRLRSTATPPTRLALPGALRLCSSSHSWSTVSTFVSARASALPSHRATPPTARA